MRRLGLLLVAVAGCKVGPDYVRPTVTVPAAYRESAGWKVARPQDATSRGPWWELFGDSTLPALERQVAVSNQSLAAAEAQLRQARALVSQARAALFPTLAIGASATRAEASSFSGTPAVVVPVAGAPVARSSFSLPLELSWEPDFWGRIRRSVEAGQASAQASAADVETARLGLHSELAQDYFQLRVLDEEGELLTRTVAAYGKALALTESRLSNGVASRADVVQATTQLRTTQAQLIDLGIQRAQLDHAIAVLVGQPASSFHLAPSRLPEGTPTIPAGLPSALLERRPDIAAAERRVAAANAQVGVAVAAFFPSITLSASAGFQSVGLTTLLSWPSRFFSVGPALSQPLFDGGLRGAQLAQARAALDGAVASYRQTVLTAFQGVEDNLAALHLLADEAVVQDQALQSARQSLQLTGEQYQAGVASYLNVITTQTIVLASETTALQLRGRRLAAAVLLIKALGGGWR
jgi:NodT family efflux transporter outer membrane factor (OMF) lipoprotein